jgi:hypothetical protein
VSRAAELGFLRAKYADVSDPRAKDAIAEYADAVYGPDWRTAPVEPPDEPRPVGGFTPRSLIGDGLPESYGSCGRRPEHSRLLRHIDWLNPKVRRIA